MESQISNMITILTSLLTGGVLMILIENLHLSNIIADRFYNKIKPFEKSLKSYILFVKLIANRITIKEDKDEGKDEHAKRFKKLFNEIRKVKHETTIHRSFTAIELEKLCEKINNIWYYLSEKSQYVRPYIDFDDYSTIHNDEEYKYALKGISPKFAKNKPTLNTLMNVSGDFYADIYSPIQDVYFEYEYWRNKLKFINTVSSIYIILIIPSLLFVLFYGVHSNICCCYIITIILSLYFIYIIFEFINIYREYVDKLR